MDARTRAALDYHAEGRPGKIEVVPTKPMATARELALAYSPGVAEPCREIHGDPDNVFKYTARGNLVAVVSNGTAVLGLGDIGPLAAKPVMEGKGVLFKRFAGIDVFDIELNTKNPEEVIRFCQLLEPTVGGINLEDISAPTCFRVEAELKRSLNIPVFHDDQHGTAIIGGAALLNACEITGKKLDNIRVVFNGAGASAIATAAHFLRLGVRREHMIMCDSKGVIYEGRTVAMNEYKAAFATHTELRALGQAMKGADVFVGLSVAGQVTPDMVATMGDDPIVFALANPDPEILPEAVLAVRNDAVCATGRSDYPNQVNNVLGFPFIFRGALDVRSKAVNEEMMLAATRALAELAREDVPDSVRTAYAGEQIRYGRNYLIPKPFDPRVLYHVAPAVARAAIESGVARVTLDMDEYRDRLRASLGPAREVMRWMMHRARQRPARVVIPEGHNDRVIRAAAEMVEEGVATPILMGRPETVQEKAKAMGVDLDGIQVTFAVDEEEARERYAQVLYSRRARKGLTLNEARQDMLKPLFFALQMVRAGNADAVLAGIESNYPEVIRPALQGIGVASGVDHVAGLHMLAFPNRELLFFADTTVNIDPDASTLVDVALLCARFVRDIGIEPRIAMVSFSNFGSSHHSEAKKTARAVHLLRRRDPHLTVDGEMQVDTAIDMHKLKEVYDFSSLKEPANVLVFPNLSAANAAYKLLDNLGGAELIGPVLLGMAKPIHILQRGSTSQDVLNLATIASVDAQGRDNQG